MTGGEVFGALGSGVPARGRRTGRRDAGAPWGLRIAVPKGRLQHEALQSFRAVGMDVPSAADLGTRSLRFRCGDLEWILVKDVDVPVYVERGGADLGIAGLDQIAEQEPDVMLPLAFSFGACRLSIIGRPGITWRGLPVVATKYPNLARKLLAQRSIAADVVELRGSVELAAVLGLATLIVDLIESGETMRANGLEEIETLLPISARLLVNRHSWALKQERLAPMVRALSETLPRDTRENTKEAASCR